MSEESMTPEQGSADLTVREAASSFESLLAAEEGDNVQPETASEQVEEVEVDEEVLDDAEMALETDESEEYEAESEDDSEIEYEEEPTEEPDRFKIKAAGQEMEVTLDELKAGYQLNADYTKKTQELSEQRKAVEAERAAVEESKKFRDYYAQRLRAVEDILKTEEVSPEELAIMKENDPLGYAMKIAENTEKKEQLARVRAEQEAIARQQQADQQAQMQQFVQQEAQKLKTFLPEFSDPAKADQVRKQIRTAAKELGFQDNEIDGVVDSRHAITLFYASEYLKMKKAKPGITKKVSQAPKMIKSGTKVKTQNRDIRKRQMNKLKQTGKVRDAAAIFENFIE